VFGVKMNLKITFTESAAFVPINVDRNMQQDNLGQLKGDLRILLIVFVNFVESLLESIKSK
jgi:hypothetical protein